MARCRVDTIAPNAFRQGLPHLSAVLPRADPGTKVQVASCVDPLARETNDLLIIRDDQVLGEVHLPEGLPVQDIDGASLVNQHLPDPIFGHLYRDNHRVIMIGIGRLEVVICKRDGRHRPDLLLDQMNRFQHPHMPLSSR